MRQVPVVSAYSVPNGLDLSRDVAAWIALRPEPRGLFVLVNGGWFPEALYDEMFPDADA